MAGDDTTSKLYVNWDTEKVRYIVTDPSGGNHRYFESIVHPENLSREQRHRVLNYCLGAFHEDEIVNYNDLFLQGEFIKEGVLPKAYALSDASPY